MSTPSGIGFVRGFMAPFGAVGQLLRLPRAWPFMLVPALVFTLLEVGIVLATWNLLMPWVNARLAGDGGGDWQHAGARAASWLAGLAFVGLGWLLSASLAPAISAPALERIVGITETELRVPARAPLGAFAEIACGLRSFLLSLALTLPVIVGLTLLEMVAPPLAVVVTPLKLLLGALGVSWGLFDYPMTLRGIGARERFAFMKRHFSVVLGFGLAFTLVFWLPCFGILMLPVGVAASTRLYWAIERAQ